MDCNHVSLNASSFSLDNVRNAYKVKCVRCGTTIGVVGDTYEMLKKLEELETKVKRIEAQVRK